MGIFRHFAPSSFPSVMYLSDISLLMFSRPYFYNTNTLYVFQIIQYVLQKVEGLLLQDRIEARLLVTF